jgi:hypothetical protein
LIVTLLLIIPGLFVLRLFFGFVPTTETLRIASLAASDEGYDIFRRDIRLTEMRGNGSRMIPGYETVALFQNEREVKSYAIRSATSDVVDLTACRLLRYNNLLSYKRSKGNDKTDVSARQIGAEVGCVKPDIVPPDSFAGERK